MSNIVKALMHNRTIGRTEPLYQYDYGQVLQFVGLDLPVAYEVHFSNASHGVATTQIGNADGVAIPDTYLTTGQTIYAWVYLHTGDDDGETEYQVMIPVIQRASISNATPTPVQQDAITEAIAALDAAVTSAETAITHYPKIEGNIWYVWDVTTGAYVSTGVQADGVDGQDGTDGYSPTISVTNITGGHRLTITDKNGTRTVDIMNGEDGQDGDDGISPVVSVTDITGGHQVSITDRSGTKTFNVMNGQNGQNGSDGADGVTFTPSVSAEGVISWTNDGGKTNPESVNIKGPAGADGQNGQNGQDGYSPTATVTKSGSTATISITDKNGTTTATVSDGTNGQDGAPGVGVPSGGTDGQMLVKDGATDYSTKWANQPTIPVWEKIVTYEVAEDSELVNVNTDSNGQAFNLSEMYVRVYLEPATTGTNDYVYAYVIITTSNGTITTSGLPTKRYQSSGAKTFMEYQSKLITDVHVGTGKTSANPGSSGSVEQISSSSVVSIKSINGIRLSKYGAATTLIPQGTTIEIYGIRQ